jgi:hypothetical protein
MEKIFKDYLKIVQKSETKPKLNIDETSVKVFIPSLARMITNIKNFFDYEEKQKKLQYNLKIKLLTKSGLEKIKEKHIEKENNRKIKVSADVKIHEMYGFNIYIKNNEKPISIYMVREEIIKLNVAKSDFYTILYVYNQSKENAEPEKIANLSIRNPNLTWKENEKEIGKLIKREIFNPII